VIVRAVPTPQLLTATTEILPDVKSGKFKIDEDYLKEVNQARYYFLNGPGNIYLPNEVKLVNLDQKKIKELLINKYSYSKTKVEKIIKKIIDA
jgi:hypothetical protein